jgi:hypothetical protein
MGVYSVNGIALDNPSKGWSLLSASKLRTEAAWAVSSVPILGRDGVVAGIAPDAGPSSLVVVVDTPVSELPALHVLFSEGGALTYDGYSGRSLAFETLSMSVTEAADDNSYVQATYVLRAPGTWWRDAADSTSGSTTLGSNTPHTVVSGLSAPVPDALVKVKGAVTGLQVTDTGSGSWFTYSQALTASEWLRFESDTGRAWKTTTDVWTGGTEVTGDIDFGGPRGVFEIWPSWSDPSTRIGQIYVSTATRSTASVQTRARGAYVG